jgi:hypothetical protein
MNEGSSHSEASQLSYYMTPLFSKSPSVKLYDFFIHDLSENLRNIVTKTLIFCKYIVNDAVSKPDFIIRSNLSTVFDIPNFIQYLSSIKQKSACQNMYGGTFVHGFVGLRTWFSGTNITFSFPVAQLLLKHFSVINAFPAQDDVALSSFLVNQFGQHICFFNIPRIDFVENIYLKFTSLATDLSEVACFRFKTKNRKDDTIMMKQFLESNFDKQFVRDEIWKRKKYIYEQKNELFSNPFFIQLASNELTSTSSV